MQVGAEPALVASGTGATDLYATIVLFPRSSLQSCYRYYFYPAPWDYRLRGLSYEPVTTTYNREAFPANATFDSPQIFSQVRIPPPFPEEHTALLTFVLGSS